MTVFLYTNNKQSKHEIKKTVPFTIISKRINYILINFIKKVQDLYPENNKTSLKEIKEGRSKWKDIPCLWTRRQYCKMAILPKLMCRFNAILKKLSFPQKLMS